MTMNHHQPSKLTTTGSSQVQPRLKPNQTRLKQLMFNKVRPFSLQAVIKYFFISILGRINQGYHADRIPDIQPNSW